MKKKGYSYKEIAEALGRSASGIWYEMKKNKTKGAYEPKKANHKAYVRRKYAKYQGMKIIKNGELKKFLRTHLLDDQSPEEISKRLKRVEKHLPYASASAIRRFIASPYGRRIEAHRNKVFKRKYRRRAVKPRIKDKRKISERPSKINKRWGLGHTEGDFIVSGKSGKGIVLGLRDRNVRKNFLEKILPVSVRAVERALVRIKKRFPELQTIAFDNDLLLLEHKRLEKKLGIKIYFCDVHAPWQKPSIENLNKSLRVYIPKGSDISKYSKFFIKKLEAKMNRRFMDCLDSLTPDEAYEREKKQKQRRAARLKEKRERSN